MDVGIDEADGRQGALYQILDFKTGGDKSQTYGAYLL